jgi:hypothetical protein
MMTKQDMEKTPPLFDDLYEKVKKASEDLKRDGYAIIEDVFTKEECLILRQKMWCHWEEISDGKLTEKTDYSNMMAKDLPPHKHGILESYRINHLKTIREIRHDHRIIAIYAFLYGTDQLTCSTDRINFKFPGRRYKSSHPWPHADQHPARLGCITIQSYVTLMDCHENDPGNRFYRGSHAIFDSFFKEKRKTSKKNDWNTLNDDEIDRLVNDEKCPLIKPTYKAGSMLLWDSRTVHSPDDGSNFEHGRFVVYTCYNKLWDNKAIDNKFIKQKKNVFTDFRATSHSPLPISIFPKLARTYGNEPCPYHEIPINKLGYDKEHDATKPNHIEEYLYLFKSYENKEGKLMGDPMWQKQYGINGSMLPFVSPYTPFIQESSLKRKKNDKKSKKNKKNKTISM